MTLLLLPLLPLLAGVLIPLLPSESVWVRRSALLAAVLQLANGFWLWAHPPADLSLSWLPRLGLQFDLGLDGLSLPLVLLAALLTAMAVLFSRLQPSAAPYPEHWL